MATQPATTNDFDQAQWDAYCDAGGDDDTFGLEAETRHFANEAGSAEAFRRFNEGEARRSALAAQAHVQTADCPMCGTALSEGVCASCKEAVA